MTEKNDREKKKTEALKASEKRPRRDLRWERLDHTANLFPVIAGDVTTNTYRISAVLTEDVDPDCLQEAVDILTKKFPGFNLRLRRGYFWYYLEEIDAPAPRVHEESEYPCRYIHADRNDQYMFRVTYYGKKINVEAFHAIADGTGIVLFLKELTYQYIRCAHPDLREKLGDGFSSDSSMDREDSFVRNFKKSFKRLYRLKRAFIFHGEKLPYRGFGVVHGLMSVSAVKKVARGKYDLSINDYLTACFVYSTYVRERRKVSAKRPIRVAVPVDLRPFFGSITTKNFFVMVSAEFAPVKEEYTFKEIADIIHESLKKQITKENLELIFSYTVSYSEMLIAKIIPLPFKNISMKIFYSMSAKSNTTTITNIGNLKLSPEYEPYVDMIHGFLPFSTGQMMKGVINSYKDKLAYTIVSAYRDTSIQQGIFSQIVSDGVDVAIETNGVYYE